MKFRDNLKEYGAVNTQKLSSCSTYNNLRKKCSFNSGLKISNNRNSTLEYYPIKK